MWAGDAGRRPSLLRTSHANRGIPRPAFFLHDDAESKWKQYGPGKMQTKKKNNGPRMAKLGIHPKSASCENVLHHER